MWSSIWLCLVAGLPLASCAVAEPASSALTPYGDASSAAERGQYDCLTPPSVCQRQSDRKHTARTHQQTSRTRLFYRMSLGSNRVIYFCLCSGFAWMCRRPMDKSWWSLLMPTTPLEAVRIGRNTYLRPSNLSQSVTTTTAVGPIIEVKPFRQPCERCDLCACIGCGERCECACNALGRLRRETSAALTAGVLDTGRWYVGVDSPAGFTLRATLVAAISLHAGETLPPRTLYGPSATQALRSEGASEGAVSADYFYYDPSSHESLKIQVELLRAGSRAAYLDVYVKFGSWPTTELHDARMRVDKIASPHATFVLQADRLINERLCVLVVSTGDSWVQYALTTHTSASSRVFMASLLSGRSSLESSRPCGGSAATSSERPARLACHELASKGV